MVSIHANHPCYYVFCFFRAFSSHKARFYVATSLFDAGLSDFQVACYLGHSEASTSHIYDKRSKEVKVDSRILETCMGNLAPKLKNSV